MKKWGIRKPGVSINLLNIDLEIFNSNDKIITAKLLNENDPLSALIGTGHWVRIK